jgi:hypothetical protein
VHKRRKRTKTNRKNEEQRTKTNLVGAHHEGAAVLQFSGGHLAITDVQLPESVLRKEKGE